MDKSDEYRANAQECERMARVATNKADKQTWLEMAAHWLRMIPQPKRSPFDRFDAAAITDSDPRSGVGD